MGPEDDQTTGTGMRIGDQYFAAGSFFCHGGDKPFEFREIEVSPTHWMPLPAAPGVAPTPAAQSTGQEAIDTPSAIWTTEMLASVRKDAETLHSRLSYRPLAGDAAPVNASEPVTLTGAQVAERFKAAGFRFIQADERDGRPALFEGTEHAAHALLTAPVNGGEREAMAQRIADLEADVKRLPGSPNWLAEYLEICRKLAALSKARGEQV